MPFRQTFIDKAVTKEGKRKPVQITDTEMLAWLKRCNLELYAPSTRPSDHTLLSLGISIIRCVEGNPRPAVAC